MKKTIFDSNAAVPKTAAGTGAVLRLTLVGGAALANALLTPTGAAAAVQEPLAATHPHAGS